MYLEHATGRAVCCFWCWYWHQKNKNGNIPNRKDKDRQIVSNMFLLLIWARWSSILNHFVVVCKQSKTDCLCTIKYTICLLLSSSSYNQYHTHIQAWCCCCCCTVINNTMRFFFLFLSVHFSFHFVISSLLLFLWLLAVDPLWYTFQLLQTCSTKLYSIYFRFNRCRFFFAAHFWCNRMQLYQ